MGSCTPESVPDIGPFKRLDSLRRKLSPQQTGHASIEEWRQHVLAVLLSTIVVLSTLVAVPSIVLAAFKGMWHVAATDAIGLFLAFGLWRANCWCC